MFLLPVQLQRASTCLSPKRTLDAIGALCQLSIVGLRPTQRGIDRISGGLVKRENDRGLRSIPVVVMTGTMAEPGDNGAKVLDVQGFLTKPVDLKKFLGLVEQLKDFWKADMILPSTGQAEAASAPTSGSL